MVFTLSGPHATDAAVNYASLYTSNKILIEFSCTHFPDFPKTNGQARADTDTSEAIRDISLNAFLNYDARQMNA